MTYTKYKEWLKANLSEERYEHSIGTAECAMELAERFKLDKEVCEYDMMRIKIK